MLIGSGFPEHSLADISMTKVFDPNSGRKIPIIPGTTLKGALRTCANRIAHLIGQTSCGEIEPSKISRAHKEMGRVCDVCRVFGVPGNPGTAISKLMISHFAPASDIKIGAITRTSIDPKSLKVQEGALFMVEYLPICSIFEGKVKLNGVNSNDIKLILAAILDLRYEVLGRGGLVDTRIINIVPDNIGTQLDEEGRQLLQKVRKWGWNLCEEL